MEGGLAGIHEILGGLVVVAFIVMAILAAVAAAGRRQADATPAGPVDEAAVDSRR